jgi:hypothetical protein
VKRTPLLFVLLLTFSLGVPASATAFRLPVVQAGNVVSIQAPRGVALDYYTGDAYVASAGPPPAIYRFREVSIGRWTLADVFPLPATTDPGWLDFSSSNGNLHVADNANHRILELCANCGRIENVIPLPGNIRFITGEVEGFRTNLLADFGDGMSAGSLFYGSRFASRLALADTITPDGVALLAGAGRTAKGRISSEFLSPDANHGTLLKISDQPKPAVTGSERGPPGASGLRPIRGVAIDHLNLAANLRGPAIDPILVPVPDLGNVFWQAGVGAPWRPVSATPLGRPAAVAANCSAIVATAPSSNQVYFFDQKPPKAAHCEDICEMIVSPGSGAPFTTSGGVAVALNAFANGQGPFSAAFGLGAKPRSGGRAAASVSTPAKRVRLRAGRVTNVRVTFSKQARAAIAAALRRRHRLFGTLTLRLTSPAGEKTTVTRTTRLTG